MSVRTIARADRLLVCLDFDGTLAELNPDPYAVQIHPLAAEAVRALAATPGTEVAILTGRHLEGLRRVLPDLGAVTLVGSHGAEPGPPLSDADLAYLEVIQARLEEIAQPPAYVEVKPFQRVLHVAPVNDPAAARAMLEEALAVPTDRPVTEGKNVVEFSAVEITKGSWLARHKKNFDATFFAGDDDTDETAMAVLGEHDMGVKVGAKPSLAHHRVDGVAQCAALLAELAKEREEWNAAR